MKIIRKKTRQIKVGNVKIGGGAPISIQSMTKSDTRDISKTIKEIKNLQNIGCEIVRVAVKDEEAAEAIREIKEGINIPLVADIHFNYNLALLAIENGADKIRLNPGNIYKKEEVEAVVRAAKERRIPIRVGVNSGSVACHCEPERSEGEAISKKRLRSLLRATRSVVKQSGAPSLLRRFASRNRSPIGKSEGFAPRNDRRVSASHLAMTVPQSLKKGELADLLVKSALYYIKLLEEMDFYDIVVSLKASDILTTIEAYRKISERIDYPLHLGITAAGPIESGLVKSSIGIGALLLEGIGDTIRVSITGDSCDEVIAAKNILSALRLKNFGPDIISCPTCGRCQVDLEKIVKRIEEYIIHNSEAVAKVSKSVMARERSDRSNLKKRLLRPFGARNDSSAAASALHITRTRIPTIAVMGCEVNGPGEARDADIGVACGKGYGAIFKNGRIIKRVKEDKIVENLIMLLKN